MLQLSKTHVHQTADETLSIENSIFSLSLGVGIPLFDIVLEVSRRWGLPTEYTNCALYIILVKNPYLLSIVNDQNQLVSKAPVGRLCCTSLRNDFTDDLQRLPDGQYTSFLWRLGWTGRVMAARKASKTVLPISGLSRRVSHGAGVWCLAGRLKGKEDV